ncbi:MAG: hypothetical protein R3F60_05480 [bacterium]
MRAVVAIGVLLAGLAGCDGQRPGGGRTDSESHWLEPCVDDSTCGALSCVCGVCSRTCTPAGRECLGLGPTRRAGAAAGVRRGGGGLHPGLRRGRPVRERGPGVRGGRLRAARVGGPARRRARRGRGRRGHAGRGHAGRGGAGRGRARRRPGGLGLPDAAPVDAAPPDAAVPGPECSDPGSTCRLDADCPSQVCSALLPAGPCQCVEAAPPPAVVPGGAGCLDDAACPGAHCQAEGTDAQNQRCGGPEPVANLCVPDACAKDADCGEGRTCVRAGEYGHVRAACVPATCRADADCVEHPEGRQPFFTPASCAASRAPTPSTPAGWTPTARSAAARGSACRCRGAWARSASWSSRRREARSPGPG